MTGEAPIDKSISKLVGSPTDQQWAALLDELDVFVFLVNPIDMAVQAASGHTRKRFLEAIEGNVFWKQLASTSEVRELQNMLRDVGLDGLTRSIEHLSHMGPKSQGVWFRSTMQRVSGTEDSPMILWAMRDISNTRLTHEHWAQAENGLQCLGEQVDFAIWMCDTQGTITFQNPVATQWLGPIIGRSYEDAELLNRFWAKGFEGALSGTKTKTLRESPKTASRKWVQWAVPIRSNEAGPVHHVLGMLLEDAEPTTSVGMAPELEKLVGLGGRAAVVAHEIRHPLGALFNAVSLIKSTPQLPETLLPLLNVLEEETQRLERLTANILGFMRPPDSKTISQPLLPVVEKALASALRLNGTNKVLVHRDFESHLPYVRLDEPGMLLALENLLRNSLEAMSGKGDLYLEVKLDGDEHVTIALEDSGPGIPDDVKQRVFAPFVTTRRSGVGLGMSIVQHVIQQNHGGTIALVDPKKGGARWLIRLPLA